MKNFPKLLRAAILLFCLAITIMVSACAVGSAPVAPAAKPAASPTSTQPVSAQKLLGTGPVTYVALGASDAVGVGTQRPQEQGYVPLIAKKLPGGSHLVNLGVSGIHLHEAMQQELPIALSSTPELITIWLVANDFVAGVGHDQYMGDLDALLKQLRKGTTARIVMANLPDLTRLPSFNGASAERKAAIVKEIKRWNVDITSIASRYQVTVVDLFSQGSLMTSHPEYVSGDGFHPSPAGYAQLANLFWMAIRE